MSKANIVYNLREREISSQRCRKLSLNSLRTLICKGDRVFKLITSKKSSKPFQYESGRLFCDKYRTCFYGYGINLAMKQMYCHQKLEGFCRGKIEDALIYKCHHENFHRFDNKASMIALQSRIQGDRLLQIDLDTGQVMKEVILPKHIIFKYLSWVETNEMFFVKSTVYPRAPRFNNPIRPWGQRDECLNIVIALFSVFPLQLKGVMELNKTVFGSAISNAYASLGMLIVMFTTGHIRLYSLEYILKHFKNYNYDIDVVQLADEQEQSRGLPFNIKITEVPPVLFEVRCEDHDVKIGGFPWHYIYTPRGSMGWYEVVSVTDHVKAENGSLSMEDVGVIEDRCEFHSDDSGRILHISGSTASVRVLQLKPGTNSERRKIETFRKIDVRPKQSNDESMPVYTSSGRCIRKRSSVDEVSSCNPTTLHQIDYEDDLDLTLISVLDLDTDLAFRVCCYDNVTFQHLRDIPLETRDSLDEIDEYSMHMDLDTIVQVIKSRPGRYICNIYRLSGDQGSEFLSCREKGDPGTKQKGKESRPRSRHRARRRPR